MFLYIHSQYINLTSSSHIAPLKHGAHTYKHSYTFDFLLIISVRVDLVEHCWKMIARHVQVLLRLYLQHPITADKKEKV